NGSKRRIGGRSLESRGGACLPASLRSAQVLLSSESLQANGLDATPVLSGTYTIDMAMTLPADGGGRRACKACFAPGLGQRSRSRTEGSKRTEGQRAPNVPRSVLRRRRWLGKDDEQATSQTSRDRAARTWLGKNTFVKTAACRFNPATVAGSVK